MRTSAVLVAAFNLLLACTAVADAGTIDGLRAWLETPREQRGDLGGQPFAKSPLSEVEAAEARALLWDDHAEHIRDTRARAWDEKRITLGDKVMPFKARTFGERPEDGWSLYLSMHGGGGVAAEVNDQQWSNQHNLYELSEGIVIAPRAPTNHWNLWHEPHIDRLFDRLIRDAIVLGGVNPNRVYIMGYSAGGDGTYQLAPRMADRWAGAAMMAGHPNDLSPLGLRNLAFTAHVGADDDGYDRNKKLVEWGKQLAALKRADPRGYRHTVRLHEGKGHWMNLEEKPGVDWVSRFDRDPRPEKVVWMQGPVTHERLYWLAVPPGSAEGGDLVVATRTGQRFEVEEAGGIEELTILLGDAMAGLDLDREVLVTKKGSAKPLFKGAVQRDIATIAKTLAGRGDPYLVFDAQVTVRLDDAE